MSDRLVIYQSGTRDWEGAVECETGRWPFKTVRHAPITHADTPELVFAWLRARYPHRVIAYDPAVTERYTGISLARKAANE